MDKKEERNVLILIAIIFFLNFCLKFTLSSEKYCIFSYLLISFILGIFFIAILMNYLFDIYRE